jgi:hypothetical protein
VQRVKLNNDTNNSKVVRLNVPRKDGTESIGQRQIAGWPNSMGIDLGQFGTMSLEAFLGGVMGK